MPSSTPQALLLVDGYNVIGAWQHLTRLREQQGLETARRELIEVLLSYSAAQDYETQVVFDSQLRDSPGNREIVTSYLSICYTDYRQTADTFIEKACAAYRKDLRKYSQRLIVATSDRAQQLTVMGYGAEWISAQRLWVEVELATQRVRRKQQSLRKQKHASRRFLANTIDPSAQAQLAKLRLGKTDRSPGGAEHHRSPGGAEHHRSPGGAEHHRSPGGAEHHRSPGGAEHHRPEMGS
ncbi:NYN domain-containing protein [Leptolyngbya sp. NK1-12]|uniref:NYN domain-containing protein n=1 Tax=Leptolyngbya sp. NK1-12 TaxID=2547451 RepID=A0AA97AJ23_9CYAN|nr:NYN domain-containing protein [Leptolyngbya sp. NK1-12]WNZ24451.1 NYN domain-containing protein [Leptolyngbya sp. NK1-12]